MRVILQPGKVLTDLENMHDRALRSAEESVRLGDENAALRAQLAAVGAELVHAREQIQIHERRDAAARRREAVAYRERETLPLVPRLVSLLPPHERLVVVDGGAREVDHDPRWRPFPPQCMRFIGFEPDRAEAERLNSVAAAGASERQFVPAGLWGSAGSIVFEHNNIGGGSSFLPQNRRVTDRWKFENANEAKRARDIFFPVRRETMNVVGLGAWAAEAGIKGIDFLKLNVQGGELEILHGAGALLDGVLGILVEVAFVESYVRRPMFADIDAALRAKGFEFFDLLAHHYVGRAESPVTARHLSVAEPTLGQGVSAWGQLIEGHALYLRDPLEGGVPSEPVQVLKLAAIAEAFGQVEYALEVLNWLNARADVVGTALGDGLREVIAAAETEYRALLRPDAPAPEA